MSNFFTIIKKLLPKGRAYSLFSTSFHEQLITALKKEPQEIAGFYKKILESGIPSGNLPVEALSDWENFLALQKNSDLSNTERNSRIKAKYAARGGQGPDYIQDILQDAGYPVYVLENTGGIDPRPHLGILIAGPAIWDQEKILSATLGNMTLGSKRLGEYLGTRIFSVDLEIPNDPDTWYYVWFLTGSGGLGDFVSIDSTKEQDFIVQVLQLKPAHTWVVAQVNFV